MRGEKGTCNSSNYIDRTGCIEQSIMRQATDVNSTYSFELQLVELSTNVNSTWNLEIELDLGSKLGEKNTKFLYVDYFLQIQSVFHFDSTSTL